MSRRLLIKSDYSCGKIRAQRAGGFGILLTNQLVDELVFNERHNELMFVKYLS